MTLANRNLVTIEDLSNGEIEAVFSLADKMAENMDKQFGVCKGKIMASLFFEPSTRTRLSFESAMHRLCLPRQGKARRRRVASASHAR